MWDLCSKSEEDHMKTEVAIVKLWINGNVNTNTQTDVHRHKHTDRRTQIYTQVILYLSNAMHCIGQTMIH